MHRLATTFAAFGLLAAACGGASTTTTAAPATTPPTTTPPTTLPPPTTQADLGATEQALAEAITAAILADEDDDLSVDEDQARCLGEGYIAAVGTARLIELGLTVEAIEGGSEPGDVDLTNDEAEALIDVTFECVDLAAVFVEAFAAEGILSAESGQCLADGFDEQFLRDIARSAFDNDAADPTDDPETAAALFELVLECLSIEELQNLGDGG